MRCALVVCALFACAPRGADAAIGIVQSQWHDQQSGDQVLLSSLTAGSTVVIGASVASGSGTITGCSDATNGAYTLSADNNPYAWVYTKRDIMANAGAVTCVSSNGASTSFDSVGFELSGPDNVASLQTDTFGDGSGTSHQCADPGFTGTGFFFGAALLGSGGTVTLGTGYETGNTLGPGAASVLQYDIKTGTNETIPYSATNSQATRCASIFVPETTGGGGGGGGHRRRLTMGVG